MNVGQFQRVLANDDPSLVLKGIDAFTKLILLQHNAIETFGYNGRSCNASNVANVVSPRQPTEVCGLLADYIKASPQIEEMFVLWTLPGRDQHKKLAAAHTACIAAMLHCAKSNESFCTIVISRIWSDFSKSIHSQVGAGSTELVHATLGLLLSICRCSNLQCRNTFSKLQLTNACFISLIQKGKTVSFQTPSAFNCSAAGGTTDANGITGAVVNKPPRMQTDARTLLVLLFCQFMRSADHNMIVDLMSPTSLIKRITHSVNKDALDTLSLILNGFLQCVTPTNNVEQEVADEEGDYNDDNNNNSQEGRHGHNSLLHQYIHIIFDQIFVQKLISLYKDGDNSSVGGGDGRGESGQGAATACLLAHSFLVDLSTFLASLLKGGKRRSLIGTCASSCATNVISALTAHTDGRHLEIQRILLDAQPALLSKCIATIALPSWDPAHINNDNNSSTISTGEYIACLFHLCRLLEDTAVDNSSRSPFRHVFEVMQQQSNNNRSSHSSSNIDSLIRNAVNELFAHMLPNGLGKREMCKLLTMQPTTSTSTGGGGSGRTLSYLGMKLVTAIFKRVRRVVLESGLSAAFTASGDSHNNNNGISNSNSGSFTSSSSSSSDDATAAAISTTTATTGDFEAVFGSVLLKYLPDLQFLVNIRNKIGASLSSGGGSSSTSSSTSRTNGATAEVAVASVDVDVEIVQVATIDTASSTAVDAFDDFEFNLDMGDNDDDDDKGNNGTKKEKNAAASATKQKIEEKQELVKVENDKKSSAAAAADDDDAVVVAASHATHAVGGYKNPLLQLIELMEACIQLQPYSLAQTNFEVLRLLDDVFPWEANCNPEEALIMALSLHSTSSNSSNSSSSSSSCINNNKPVVTCNNVDTICAVLRLLKLATASPVQWASQRRWFISGEECIKTLTNLIVVEDWQAAVKRTSFAKLLLLSTCMSHFHCCSNRNKREIDVMMTEMKDLERLATLARGLLKIVVQKSGIFAGHGLADLELSAESGAWTNDALLLCGPANTSSTSSSTSSSSGSSSTESASQFSFSSSSSSSSSLVLVVDTLFQITNHWNAAISMQCNEVITKTSAVEAPQDIRNSGNSSSSSSSSSNSHQVISPVMYCAMLLLRSDLRLFAADLPKHVRSHILVSSTVAGAGGGAGAPTDSVNIAGDNGIIFQQEQQQQRLAFFSKFNSGFRANLPVLVSNVMLVASSSSVHISAYMHNITSVAMYRDKHDQEGIEEQEDLVACVAQIKALLHPLEHAIMDHKINNSRDEGANRMKKKKNAVASKISPVLDPLPISPAHWAVWAAELDNVLIAASGDNKEEQQKKKTKKKKDKKDDKVLTTAASASSSSTVSEVKHTADMVVNNRCFLVWYIVQNLPRVVQQHDVLLEKEREDSSIQEGAKDATLRVVAGLLRCLDDNWLLVACLYLATAAASSSSSSLEDKEVVLSWLVKQWETLRTLIETSSSSSSSSLSPTLTLEQKVFVVLNGMRMQQLLLLQQNSQQQSREEEEEERLSLVISPLTVCVTCTNSSTVAAAHNKQERSMTRCVSLITNTILELVYKEQCPALMCDALSSSTVVDHFLASSSSSSSTTSPSFSSCSSQGSSVESLGKCTRAVLIVAARATVQRQQRSSQRRSANTKTATAGTHKLWWHVAQRLVSAAATATNDTNDTSLNLLDDSSSDASYFELYWAVQNIFFPPASSSSSRSLSSVGVELQQICAASTLRREGGYALLNLRCLPTDISVDNTIRRKVALTTTKATDVVCLGGGGGGAARVNSDYLSLPELAPVPASVMRTLTSASTSAVQQAVTQLYRSALADSIASAGDATTSSSSSSTSYSQAGERGGGVVVNALCEVSFSSLLGMDTLGTTSSPSYLDPLALVDVCQVATAAVLSATTTTSCVSTTTSSSVETLIRTLVLEHVSVAQLTQSNIPHLLSRNRLVAHSTAKEALRFLQQQLLPLHTCNNSSRGLETIEEYTETVAAVCSSASSKRSRSSSITSNMSTASSASAAAAAATATNSNARRRTRSNSAQLDQENDVKLPSINSISTPIEDENLKQLLIMAAAVYVCAANDSNVSSFGTIRSAGERQQLYSTLVTLANHVLPTVLPANADLTERQSSSALSRSKAITSVFALLASGDTSDNDTKIVSLLQPLLQRLLSAIVHGGDDLLGAVTSSLSHCHTHTHSATTLLAAAVAQTATAATASSSNNNNNNSLNVYWWEAYGALLSHYLDAASLDMTSVLSLDSDAPAAINGSHGNNSSSAAQKLSAAAHCDRVLFLMNLPVFASSSSSSSSSATIAKLGRNLCKKVSKWVKTCLKFFIHDANVVDAIHQVRSAAMNAMQSTSTTSTSTSSCCSTAAWHILLLDSTIGIKADNASNTVSSSVTAQGATVRALLDVLLQPAVLLKMVVGHSKFLDLLRHRCSEEIINNAVNNSNSTYAAKVALLKLLLGCLLGCANAAAAATSGMEANTNAAAAAEAAADRTLPAALCQHLARIFATAYTGSMSIADRLLLRQLKVLHTHFACPSLDTLHIHCGEPFTGTRFDAYDYQLQQQEEGGNSTGTVTGAALSLSASSNNPSLKGVAGCKWLLDGITPTRVYATLLNPPFHRSADCQQIVGVGLDLDITAPLTKQHKRIRSDLHKRVLREWASEHSKPGYNHESAVRALEKQRRMALMSGKQRKSSKVANKGGGNNDFNPERALRKRKGAIFDVDVIVASTASTGIHSSTPTAAAKKPVSDTATGSTSSDSDDSSSDSSSDDSSSDDSSSSDSESNHINTAEQRQEPEQDEEDEEDGYAFGTNNGALNGFDEAVLDKTLPLFDTLQLFGGGGTGASTTASNTSSSSAAGNNSGATNSSGGSGSAMMICDPTYYIPAIARSLTMLKLTLDELTAATNTVARLDAEFAAEERYGSSNGINSSSSDKQQQQQHRMKRSRGDESTPVTEYSTTSTSISSSCGALSAQLSAHLAEVQLISMRQLANKGVIALVILCLSSACPIIRMQCLASLEAVYALLKSPVAEKDTSFRERPQLLWLVFSIRNSFSNSFHSPLTGGGSSGDDAYAGGGAGGVPMLPPTMAIFLARASMNLMQPFHEMYGKINKYLLSRPFVDSKDVPLFDMLVVGGDSATEHNERAAALRLIRDGLRSKADHLNMCRKNAYNRLMLLFPVLSRDQRCGHAVLDIIDRGLSTCGRSGARYLLERCGLAQWLEIRANIAIASVAGTLTTAAAVGAAPSSVVDKAAATAATAASSDEVVVNNAVSEGTAGAPLTVGTASSSSSSSSSSMSSGNGNGNAATVRYAPRYLILLRRAVSAAFLLCVDHLASVSVAVITSVVAHDDGTGGEGIHAAAAAATTAAAAAAAVFSADDSLKLLTDIQLVLISLVDGVVSTLQNTCGASSSSSSSSSNNNMFSFLEYIKQLVMCIWDVHQARRSLHCMSNYILLKNMGKEVTTARTQGNICESSSTTFSSLTTAATLASTCGNPYYCGLWGAPPSAAAAARETRNEPSEHSASFSVGSSSSNSSNSSSDTDTETEICSNTSQGVRGNVPVPSIGIHRLWQLSQVVAAICSSTAMGNNNNSHSSSSSTSSMTTAAHLELSVIMLLNFENNNNNNNNSCSGDIKLVSLAVRRMLHLSSILCVSGGAAASVDGSCSNVKADQAEDTDSSGRHLTEKQQQQQQQMYICTTTSSSSSSSCRVGTRKQPQSYYYHLCDSICREWLYALNTTSARRHGEIREKDFVKSVDSSSSSISATASSSTAYSRGTGGGVGYAAQLADAAWVHFGHGSSGGGGNAGDAYTMCNRLPTTLGRDFILQGCSEMICGRWFTADDDDAQHATPWTLMAQLLIHWSVSMYNCFYKKNLQNTKYVANCFPSTTSSSSSPDISSCTNGSRCEERQHYYALGCTPPDFSSICSSRSRKLICDNDEDDEDGEEEKEEEAAAAAAAMIVRYLAIISIRSYMSLFCVHQQPAHGTSAVNGNISSSGNSSSSRSSSSKVSKLLFAIDRVLDSENKGDRHTCTSISTNTSTSTTTSSSGSKSSGNGRSKLGKRARSDSSAESCASIGSSCHSPLGDAQRLPSTELILSGALKAINMEKEKEKLHQLCLLSLELCAALYSTQQQYAVAVSLNSSSRSSSSDSDRDDISTNISAIRVLTDHFQQVYSEVHPILSYSTRRKQSFNGKALLQSKSNNRIENTARSEEDRNDEEKGDVSTLYVLGGTSFAAIDFYASSAASTKSTTSISTTPRVVNKNSKWQGVYTSGLSTTSAVDRAMSAASKKRGLVVAQQQQQKLKRKLNNFALTSASTPSQGYLVDNEELGEEEAEEEEEEDDDEYEDEFQTSLHQHSAITAASSGGSDDKDSGCDSESIESSINNRQRNECSRAGIGSSGGSKLSIHVESLEEQDSDHYLEADSDYNDHEDKDEEEVVAEEEEEEYNDSGSETFHP